MSLRTGDRITLTLNPTIRLSRFDSVKPFVSIQRVMGDDPAADLADLEADVQTQFHRAVLREIGVLDGAAEALGENGTLNDLAEWCEKELGDGISAQATQEVSTPKARKGGKPVKKRKRVRRE